MLRRLLFQVLIAAAAALAASNVFAADGALDITPKSSEASGAADAPRIRLYGASKALVIGIDNYGASAGWFGGTATKGWPKLAMAIKDAEEVAQALQAAGFTVTLLKDLKAEDLDRVFRDFFIKEGSDPEARLFVWFAGHGHTVNGEGYLVPADAPHPKEDIEFRGKALSLRRFGEYMREARAKHVLAVFDSCFAGTVFNVARAAPPPAITYSTGQPVRQFVSSGEAEQEVSDDGTFRKLFIDALAGKERDADPNRDGYITGTELGQFLFDKVTNLTRTRQTPRYGKLNALGFDRGDFVLQAKALDAPGVAAPAPVTAAPPATAPQNLSEAAQAWALVQSSEDLSVLEAFRKQYGPANAFYDRLAAARIEDIARRSAAATAKADEERKAQEAERARAAAEAERKQREIEAAEAEAARRQRDIDAAASAAQEQQKRKESEARAREEADRKRHAELQAIWAKERADALVGEQSKKSANMAFGLEPLPGEVRAVVELARRNERTAQERAGAARARAEAANRVAQQAAHGGRGMWSGLLSDGLGRYSGQLSNNKLNGLGRFSFVKGIRAGDQYSGEFGYGEFNGLGVLTLVNNANNKGQLKKYSGEFIRGQFSGFGVFEWQNGSIYAGSVAQSGKDGAGVNRRANDRYEGAYTDNKQHGLGVVWNADGSIRSLGRWVDDQLVQSLTK